MLSEYIRVMLRDVRDAQGFTQAELAKEIGLSQGAIARFENGRSTLSAESLRKISRTLNLKEDFAEFQRTIVFEQVDPNLPIEVGITKRSGNPRYNQYNDEVLNYIFRGQYAPEIRLLTLAKIMSGKRLLEDHTIVAIAIRDSENNYFLIHEKNRKHLLSLSWARGLPDKFSSYRDFLRGHSIREVEALPQFLDKFDAGKPILVSDLKPYFTMDPLHLKRVFSILRDIISSRPALRENEVCASFLELSMFGGLKLKIKNAEILIPKLCEAINSYFAQEDLFQ